MEKMFKSAMGEPLPAASSSTSARPKSKSLQRGLSFCVDPRKLVETSEKWHTFLKQLHERRRKIYRIVNALHDQRLSEQRGSFIKRYTHLAIVFLVFSIAILDDIEQGFGQVHSDSKNLKQLQLEQTRIKVFSCTITKLYCILRGKIKAKTVLYVHSVNHVHT